MTKEESAKEPAVLETKKQICPDASFRECHYGETVSISTETYVWSLQVLYPMDDDPRSQHINSCTKALEKDMEFFFAVQCSKIMVCSICREVVYEKAKPRAPALGSCTTANTPTVSSAFKKVKVLSNFRAGS